MLTKYKTAPDGKDLVRLFNNTPGSFTHEITLADGVTKKTYVLPGNTFAKVPKEVADAWLELFPKRVVTDTEAHETANAAKAELASAEKRIAELEALLAKAKGEKPLTKAQQAAADKAAEDKAAEEKDAADKAAAKEKKGADAV